MKVLIDIGHPAHVHFFREPLARLRAQQHEVLVTSRIKEMAVELLDALGVEHVTLSAQRGGALALGRELLLRDARLLRVARRFRPDVMAAIGGIFIAHVGALTRIPSLVFYDTENARAQNALTYPLAHRVIVPDCYQAWVPARRTLRYRGYHELSYLQPDVFQPERAVAEANGLASEGPTWLLRLVSWQANHDLGETGWSTRLLTDTVAALSARGRVIISAEAALPPAFDALRYRGDPALIHHLMAYCAGFIGESATMASECAVLGVPAVYAARTGRGYTDEQQSRYALVKNVRTLSPAAIAEGVAWLLAQDRASSQAARARLLADCIDVPAFVTDCIRQVSPAPGRYEREGRRACAG